LAAARRWLDANTIASARWIGGGLSRSSFYDRAE
jgi:hypothetical protein